MAMTKHRTGTPEEWLAARLELLNQEKELTRRSDDLARMRQELPWVRIDKTYQFETDEGSGSLKDLFRGRSQILVYHFMFGPDYLAGCPSCSAIADGFNGIATHLANHDVMLWAVSRAPLAKLRAFKRRMGWTFPWASSLGSDFNFDFNVTISEAQQREGYEYNFRRETPTPRPQISRATPDGPTQGAAIRVLAHGYGRTFVHDHLRRGTPEGERLRSIGERLAALAMRESPEIRPDLDALRDEARALLAQAKATSLEHRR
jgi:predicted dithiol-disulfide oxidoreductase (DUF899 family)